MTLPIVSLLDAKAYLNIPDSDTMSDGEVQDFLDSATELVREETRDYGQQTYTETVPVYDGEALLSHTPVAGVASVVSAVSGESITGWSVDSWGRLTGLPWWGALLYWRRITVTYTAGNPIPTARMATATLMVLGRLWQSQRGNAPTVLQGADGAVFTPGMQGILAEVRALLGPGTVGTFA